MYFPEHEYRSQSPYRGSDAPGQTQQTVGRIDISKQRNQVLGIFGAVAVAGASFGFAGVLGLLALAINHSEPTQSPMPFVYATLFFFSVSVVMVLIASGIAGRLLKYIYDSELIIATQDHGLTDYREDNAWLVARLSERAVSAEGSGGSSRRATPSAETIFVFPTNGRRH